MKIGLIARSEDRGLGNLTWEWAQHMDPDRVLIVVPNHRARQRLARYDRDATVLGWDHHRQGTLDEPIVRQWLQGLDVVYSAETFYDWRVCDWARDMKVRTVCHVMPEYFRHREGHQLSSPDAWWTPTHYRLQHLAPTTRVVPVPVAVERFAAPMFHVERRPPRWLHVAGIPASGDRNGTMIVRRAIRELRREHHITIRSVQPIPRPVTPRLVRLTMTTRGAAEYWQLYDDQPDLLLAPRRYAGLSLPALEAMASGAAVLMSDVEPQASEWPILSVPAEKGGTIEVAGGTIPLMNVSPEALAARMDWLADHPEEIMAARRRAYTFAQSQSWEALAPVIRSELERVVA